MVAPATHTAALPPAASAPSVQSAVAQLEGTPALAEATSLAPAPAGESAPVLGTGVGMQEMIDAIRATVEVATRQGIAQARIALQPEELGEIRIHLSQTADGLLARVTADTPAAAQALAQGRSELHQSLSTLGLSLRLDIGSSPNSQSGEQQARFAGAEGRSSGAGAAEAEQGQGSGEHAEEMAPAKTSSGGLVDVLA